MDIKLAFMRFYCCCLLLLMCATQNVWAEGLAIKSANLELKEEVYHLNALLEVSLNRTLEEALNHGLPLNFVVEFKLAKPRAFWFDEEIAAVQQNLRLSYHALTRNYQLSSNLTQKNFVSLSQLLEELSEIRGWPVLDRSLVKKRYNYIASLRLRLDLSQLPQPLQVNAIGSKDWNLASDWYPWSLTP